MEDRQAPRFRPLGQGIPATPIGGIPVHKDGIPAEQGVLTTVETVNGIPAGPGPSKPQDTGPAKCTATTKKGNPCKAYATASGVLCVGHSQ